MRPQEQGTHAPTIFDPRHQSIRPSYQNCGKFYGRGQLKLLPIAHVYPCAWALMRSAGSSNGVGNNGLTESVPLLGIYAFRDRHVTSPSCLLRAALMYVISICNFTCIWRLPDVYWMASSFGSTAVSHIALHAMRIHAYMESYRWSTHPACISLPIPHSLADPSRIYLPGLPVASHWFPNSAFF